MMTAATSGWALRRLDSVGTIVTGGTPPTSDRSNYGDEYMFAGPADLGEFKYVLSTAKMLSKKGFSSSRKIPKGSTLFVCIGSTIGKVGLAVAGLTTNQQINSIIPGPEVDSEYLYYAATTISSIVRDQAGEQAVPLVSKSSFSEFEIAVPPLDEQKRIAFMLSDADAECVVLKRLISKRRAIKQGMMQGLLTGRTRLPGFSGEWASSTIASLARATGGSTPSTRVPAYWGGDIPWFTPAEIAASGSGLVSKSERSITCDGLVNSGASLLPTGTVLVTSRASIGNTAVAAVPVTTNQGFASLIPNSPKSIWFLYYWIQQNKAELESRSAGSTFLEISARKVAAIPVEAPSLDEQEAIGRVLQDVDAEIAVLERRLESACAIKQGMMQELLTGRTRLVPAENAV